MVWSMSPSDLSTGPQDARVRAAVSELERLSGDDVSPEAVRAIVSAVTRLYATASTRAGVELPPLSPDVSTTDALTLACALVRSHGLTPFEMSVWWHRSPG